MTDSSLSPSSNNKKPMTSSSGEPDGEYTINISSPDRRIKKPNPQSYFSFDADNSLYHDSSHQKLVSPYIENSSSLLSPNIIQKPLDIVFRDGFRDEPITPSRPAILSALTPKTLNRNVPAETPKSDFMSFVENVLSPIVIGVSPLHSMSPHDGSQIPISSNSNHWSPFHSYNQTTNSRKSSQSQGANASLGDQYETSQPSHQPLTHTTSESRAGKSNKRSIDSLSSAAANAASGGGGGAPESVEVDQMHGQSQSFTSMTPPVSARDGSTQTIYMGAPTYLMANKKALAKRLKGTGWGGVGEAETSQRPQYSEDTTTHSQFARPSNPDPPRRPGNNNNSNSNNNIHNSSNNNNSYHQQQQPSPNMSQPNTPNSGPSQGGHRSSHSAAAIPSHSIQTPSAPSQSPSLPYSRYNNNSNNSSGGNSSHHDSISGASHPPSFYSAPPRIISVSVPSDGSGKSSAKFPARENTPVRSVSLAASQGSTSAPRPSQHVRHNSGGYDIGSRGVPPSQQQPVTHNTPGSGSGGGGGGQFGRGYESGPYLDDRMAASGSLMYDSSPASAPKPFNQHEQQQQGPSYYQGQSPSAAATGPGFASTPTGPPMSGRTQGSVGSMRTPGPIGYGGSSIEGMERERDSRGVPSQGYGGHGHGGPPYDRGVGGIERYDHPQDREGYRGRDMSSNPSLADDDNINYDNYYPPNTRNTTDRTPSPYHQSQHHPNHSLMQQQQSQQPAAGMDSRYCERDQEDSRRVTVKAEQDRGRGLIASAEDSSLNYSTQPRDEQRYGQASLLPPRHHSNPRQTQQRPGQSMQYPPQQYSSQQPPWSESIHSASSPSYEGLRKTLPPGVDREDRSYEVKREPQRWDGGSDKGESLSYGPETRVMSTPQPQLPSSSAPLYTKQTGSETDFVSNFEKDRMGGYGGEYERREQVQQINQLPHGTPRASSVPHSLNFSPYGSSGVSGTPSNYSNTNSAQSQGNDPVDDKYLESRSYHQQSSLGPLPPPKSSPPMDVPSHINLDDGRDSKEGPESSDMMQRQYNQRQQQQQQQSYEGDRAGPHRQGYPGYEYEKFPSSSRPSPHSTVAQSTPSPHSSQPPSTRPMYTASSDQRNFSQAQTPHQLLQSAEKASAYDQSMYSASTPTLKPLISPQLNSRPPETSIGYPYSGDDRQKQIIPDREHTPYSNQLPGGMKQSDGSWEGERGREVAYNQNSGVQNLQYDRNMVQQMSSGQSPSTFNSQNMNHHSNYSSKQLTPLLVQPQLPNIYDDNDDIFNQNSENVAGKTNCSCKKSRCLKLYCDCFRGRTYCETCFCTDCANNSRHESLRRQAMRAIMERNPFAFNQRLPQAAKEGKEGLAIAHMTGCHCKKSACLKKYCECFQAQIACTSKCRCVGCLNTPERMAATLASERAEQRESASRAPPPHNMTPLSTPLSAYGSAMEHSRSDTKSLLASLILGHPMTSHSLLSAVEQAGNITGRSPLLGLPSVHIDSNMDPQEALLLARNIRGEPLIPSLPSMPSLSAPLSIPMQIPMNVNLNLGQLGLGGVLRDGAPMLLSQGGGVSTAGSSSTGTASSSMSLGTVLPSLPSVQVPSTFSSLTSTPGTQPSSSATSAVSAAIKEQKSLDTSTAKRSAPSESGDTSYPSAKTSPGSGSTLVVMSRPSPPSASSTPPSGTATMASSLTSSSATNSDSSIGGPTGICVQNVSDRNSSQGPVPLFLSPPPANSQPNPAPPPTPAAGGPPSENSLLQQTPPLPFSQSSIAPSILSGDMNSEVSPSAKTSSPSESSDLQRNSPSVKAVADSKVAALELLSAVSAAAAADRKISDISSPL